MGLQIANISEKCKEWNQICGANKNLFRVIPSMVDGLKPGARRLMYTMYKEFRDRKTKYKVATIVGSTLKIHPHGDAAVTDNLVSLAQFWNNNAPLISPKGNFGSPMGSDHAAGRYIEASLSDYAWECFFKDFEESNVDMKPSNDAKYLEPVTLPAKYPHALLNGTLGIGYGLSSNIPPYNLTEVFNATIQLIKNPNSKIYLVPDSPTGCIVVDDGQYQDITDTGIGKFRMRASVDIDENTNTITITSTPYQVSSNDIKQGIIRMKERKELEELIDMKDQSNLKNGIKVILKIKPDVNPYKFVEKLYKKDVGLENTYPVNIKLIDDYMDRDFSVKSFLLEWLEYRRDLIRSSYNFKLTALLEKQHINDILLYILADDGNEELIDLAKSSRNKEDLADKIMKRWKKAKMTSLQASTIAGMAISSFSKDAYAEYKERKVTLAKEIGEVEDILKDDTFIDNRIIDELNDGIKKFGSPRKSKIVNLAKKKDIPDTEHILAISNTGLCKKLSIGIDYTGKVGSNNDPYMVIKINNRDNLLVFDSEGNVAKIAVSSLPSSDMTDDGIPLCRYFDIKGEIIAVLDERDDSISSNKTHMLIFTTARGYMKRTPLSDFSNIKGSKMCMKLNDGDKLVSVNYSYNTSTKDIILFTKNGLGMRMDINNIYTYGRTAMGTRCVDVPSGDEVVSAYKINPTKEYLMYITNNGKSKLTELKYFPKMKARSELVTLIPLEDNEELVSIISVSQDDKVVVFKKSTPYVTIPVNTIPVLTRAAKPVKILPVPRGDKILSVKPII